jgi:hypothetical protein
MRKSVIAIFAVIILIGASFLGVLQVNQVESPDDPQNEIDDDWENVDYREDQNQNSLSQSEPAVELDWMQLPDNLNPSAKIFYDAASVGIEYELSELDFLNTDSGEVVYVEGLDPMLEPGAPLLPELRFFVAVPQGSEVIAIDIVEGEPRQLAGYHDIAPYLPKTMDGESAGVTPNLDIYESTEPFPSEIYQIEGPDKLRHLDALEVVLYPVSYRPALGMVEVYDLMRIRVDLEFKAGNLPTISEGDSLDVAILDLVVNPEDVVSSSELKTEKQRGTRAPSTIRHTLGFHGDVQAINSLKDTTVGNGDDASLLTDDDELYYDAEAGKTLYVDGFNVGPADMGASLEYAMLHVQYKGTTDYTGNSKVRWAMEGDALKDTTIQPENLSNAESDDLTFDLLGNPGSPSLISDLLDLDIEFSENGVLGGSKDIPFDYIWIEFAYREELAGDSDYLIITDFAFSDELRVLSEWKTDRLNIDTQVYDTDWIDSNWDGSNLMHRIFDFVKSMFENYSIEYVLLGGDENVVPTNTSSSGYDSFYANVVGFVYPDLATGRLPTDLDSEMEGMVNDILAHQRDMGTWKKNVYLIGTNVFNSGDGKRDMEYAKDNYLLDLGHTFYEDYEIEGNITRTRTIDTYNLGMGLSIITGHGSKYGWYKRNGTQNFFNRNDVTNSMTNSDKRGFVWSSTCSSSGFVGSTMCIGEMWVRARNGGGIGYIGAGKIAFYSSTMWLYRRFYEAYNEMKIAGEDPTQGVAHMKALNKINYRTYLLFGDPQVGLGLSAPNIQVATGSFGSGSFVEQMGFDQTEQVTFDVNVNFPKSVLPRGVNFNFSIQNENGDTFYIDEIYIDDPADSEESFFLNWSVPSGVSAGIYNFSMKAYNTSQNWEFTFQNNTYFFVDYRAEITLVEQVNTEVIEGDTVTYKIHINNYLEPIPNAKVWILLEGRDYDPYMTPFDHYDSKITTIASGLGVIIEVDIMIPEPGTYNVSAGIHIDWALMDSVSGYKTEVRGIRILDVKYNYPIYFREDTIIVSYRYFAFSDFTASASILVLDQINQVYTPHNFFNGTGWLNYTWTVPRFIPNGTYDIDLEIIGLGRTLEVRTDSMRVVIVREILDLGEYLLNLKQETDGGWNQSDWGWPPGSDYNETARAMQALLWSGVEQSDSMIQDAADYIENNIYLDVVARVDKLAEVIWALVDAGRGSSPETQAAAATVRKMQNWVYEPEIWGVYFEGANNTKWLVNVSAYDESDSLMYWHEDSGIFTMDWEGIWFNFSVFPDTVRLNVTLKTNHTFFMRQLVYPPFFDADPMAWGGIWMNDYDTMGDGILWNRTCSEDFEFDHGWGERKGYASIGGFTAWGVIGLIQSGALGPYEKEALYSGVDWLINNQSADGSWFPWAFDGMMGMGGSFAYPGSIVGSWAEDHIQNTAISVIALVMNGTKGASVNDGITYLKTRQIEDGSYPWLTGPWYYKINLVSTAHTLRALRRTGHVFTMDYDFVKEGVRWLCAAQDENFGTWDMEANYTRVTSEAMLALASLSFERKMNLDPGWNLISLNLELEDTSLGSVLTSISGDYDAVQWYNAGDPVDPWKHNHNAKPNHVNDLKGIDNKMGLWVHITNPAGATLIFYGSEPKRNSGIGLHKGWNLVSYPSLSNRDRALALNNMNFGTDINIIQWHDAGSGSWKVVGSGDKMEVGKGYWVYSSVDMVWEVPI